MNLIPPGSPDDRTSDATGGAVFCELIGGTFGWQYQLTGATYQSGWRPTRAWAKRAGRRRMRALTRRR